LRIGWCCFDIAVAHAAMCACVRVCVCVYSPLQGGSALSLVIPGTLNGSSTSIKVHTWHSPVSKSLSKINSTLVVKSAWASLSLYLSLSLSLSLFLSLSLARSLSLSNGANKVYAVVCVCVHRITRCASVFGCVCGIHKHTHTHSLTHTHRWKCQTT